MKRAGSILMLAALSAACIAMTGCVVTPVRGHAAYAAPHRVWVPGHWRGGIWIRGHWR